MAGFSIFLGRPYGLFADLPQRARDACYCERVMLDRVGASLLERYAPCILWRIARTNRYAWQFDSGHYSAKTAPEITISDGLLRLDAAISVALTTISLPTTPSPCMSSKRKAGERVAQGDVGVGPGAIRPRLRSEIDVSALPPGDYELRVALYDWQTGARLSTPR